MKIIDLSRELYHRTPCYPGQPPVIHGIWKTHEEAFAESGNIQGNTVMFFSMPDHGGTHIDAPRHFGTSGTSIDKYPLEKCIVPGICIDLRHIAPRAEITPQDLEKAVEKAGSPVPKGGTVLLCTGHHERTFPTRRLCHRQFRASMSPPPNGWPSRASSISASTRCGRVPRARSMRWCTRPALNSTSPISRACATWRACSARDRSSSSACRMKWREGTGSPIRAVAVFND